jgi:hypothetical protein
VFLGTIGLFIGVMLIAATGRICRINARVKCIEIGGKCSTEPREARGVNTGESVGFQRVKAWLEAVA